MQSSRSLYHALAQMAVDLVIVVDKAGAVTYTGPSLQAIMGFEETDVIGKPFVDFVHPEDLSKALGSFDAIQYLRNTNLHAEYRCRRKDGDWVVMSTYARNLLDDPTIKGIVVTGRDITESRRIASQLIESEAKYRGLVEQSIAGIYIIDEGRIAYANHHMAEIFGYADDEICGLPIETVVAESDLPLVQRNIERRLRGEIPSVAYTFTGRRKDGALIDIGAHGSVSVINGHAAIIGMLQDITARRRAETQEKLYVERLERAMSGTIGALTAMVEMRDPYTSGHERRVGDLACRIAWDLKLPEERIQGIEITGRLHDIGKITVPAEILAKPGRLTTAEFDIVKSHADQGYQILRSIEFPWPVATWVHQHHERLNGSGYPLGLRDDQIFMESRILAVADVVESMASHRPYRPGLGIDAALSEISSNAGRLYDSDVVDACVNLFRNQGYALLPRDMLG